MGRAGLRRAAAISCVALALLAAAGCSGSGGTSKTATPPPDLAQGPTSTALPADQATAVAALGADEMVDYTDKDGRYTVKLPRGWPVEANTNVMIASLAGDPVRASLGIFCLPDADIEGIEGFDQQGLTNSGAGPIPLNQAVKTTAAGVDAVQVQWTQSLGGAQTDRVFVYFVGGGCAWRIQMTVWPGNDTSLAVLKPILDTVKASFTFKK